MRGEFARSPTLIGVAGSEELDHRPASGRRFFVVVLTMVPLVVAGVVQVRSIDDKLTVINDQNAVKQRFAINFRGSVHDRAIAVRDVVLATDDAQIQSEVDLIAKLADKYTASEDKMNAIFSNPADTSDAEKAAFAGINKVQEQTLPLIEQVVALQSAGKHTQALKVLVEQAKPAFVEWLRVINVFIDLEEAMNQKESAAARHTAGTFIVWMTTLLLIAVAIAVLVAWRSTRSITRPLAEAGEVMAAVAGGDMTRRLDVRSQDEVGRMSASMNAALDSVGAVLTRLAQSSGTLGATGSVPSRPSWRAARSVRRPRPRRSLPRPVRCLAASRPSRPARKRWARRSARSRRMPVRRPTSPRRPSRSPAPPPRPCPGSASPARRSAR
ncbi:MCP four helix bundle domain-containing protein [Paractinoplanes toevensis]|uniref:HAMP domain-containing protein n=1 Tax=Paractinoplanes toevensis TaxID=571911 RepID=A0A919VZN1_9ACTN|nr:HAMP domain-containing protein [Actinoplanes toevensis]GIM90302.1 hypothetical protein Ato02nite_020950 [Actinoplanes toevensis]